MSKKEKSLLERLYRAKYYENCEAAMPDYLEYFESEFSPEQVNWEDEDAAKSSVESLISELCECGEDEELLRRCFFGS